MTPSANTRDGAGKYDLLWEKIRGVSDNVEANEAMAAGRPFVSNRDTSAPELGTSPMAGHYTPMQTPDRNGMYHGVNPVTAPQVGGYGRGLLTGDCNSPVTSAQLLGSPGGFRRPNPPRTLPGSQNMVTTTTTTVPTNGIHTEDSDCFNKTSLSVADSTANVMGTCSAAANGNGNTPGGEGFYPFHSIHGIQNGSQNGIQSGNGTPGTMTSQVPRSSAHTASMTVASSDYVTDAQNTILAPPVQHYTPAQYQPNSGAIAVYNHGQNPDVQPVNARMFQALNGPTGNLERLDLATALNGNNSKELNRLLQAPGGITIDDVMKDENLPFIVGPSLGGQQVDWGVIKIMNIPFDASRNEIDAFLGRNCGLIDDKHEPIHIIMDRLTGKTMDAYIEFHTLDAASKAVQRHQDNCRAGRPSKIRDREIDVELSSQNKLMKEIFPKAKGVQWVGNQPAFEPNAGTAAKKGFAGFITNEELTVVSKLVDNPHRCPFSKDAPERPYEFMITTLKKYPWNQMDRITVKDQYFLYKTCYGMVVRLQRRMERRNDYPARLTVTLLKRFTSAICLCPGFTVLQKSNIADLANFDHQRRLDLGIPNFGLGWKHQYAVSVKMGFPLDLIEWYLTVVRDEMARVLTTMPVLQRQQIEEKGRKVAIPNHWGYFWYALDYNRESLDGMTLAECAHREFNAIESLLRRAFPPKHVPLYYQHPMVLPAATAGHELC